MDSAAGGHRGGDAPAGADAARKAVYDAFRAGVLAADPDAALRRYATLEGDRLRLGPVDSLDLGQIDGVWIVGAGKGTPKLAAAALSLFGDRVRGGSITTKDGHSLGVTALEEWEAAHPLPDARGLAGASEALRIARALSYSDLLVCLLSGGASALWPAPVAGVSLGDLRRVSDSLLRAGAPIGELNAVRKHLSRISGGQLARATAARVVTLAVSDVVGSPPDVIGSGPTVPDPTTFADALGILRDRGVRAPAAVTRHLERGATGDAPETPKPHDPLWERTSFHIVASIREALTAAADRLATAGVRAIIASDSLEGEAREVALEVVAAARSARGTASGPRAILWGGETTVTVRGRGRGGRSQEMAAAAASAIAGEEWLVIGCLATDGTDGPTDAAGGVVDGGSVERARRQGVDVAEALENNDAYAFLRAAGDLAVTGPTGTNVNDLVVALLL